MKNLLHFHAGKKEKKYGNFSIGNCFIFWGNILCFVYHVCYVLISTLFICIHICRINRSDYLFKYFKEFPLILLLPTEYYQLNQRLSFNDDAK